MFFLKKLVSEFLYPLPICSIALLLVLVHLFRKRNKSGIKLKWLTISVFLLFFLGLRPFSDLAILSLETGQEVYESRPGKHVEYIAVLSGGARIYNGRPYVQQLGSATLSRLLEGIRVAKIHPNAKLLLSGGSIGQPMSMAHLMKNAAIELGVSEDRIVLEDQSKDTEDQAIMVKEIVNDHRTVLVTSANHMRRSAGLFNKQNVLIELAPCNFRYTENRQNPWYWIIPHSISLVNWRSVIHEYVGLAWATMRGKI